MQALDGIVAAAPAGNAGSAYGNGNGRDTGYVSAVNGLSSSRGNRHSGHNGKRGGEAAHNTVPSAFQQFMNYANQIPLLSPEKEGELLTRVREGDKRALNDLVEANYRLVASIALRLRPGGERSSQGERSFDFMDLVQEGVIGLQRAALKYDIEEAFRRGREKRYAFSTYATFWIRQGMTHFIYNNGLTMRLPAHTIETLRSVNRSIDKLIELNGAEPSVDEIVSDTGLSERKVQEMLGLRSSPVVSLDDPILDGNSGTLADVIADPSIFAGADADMPYDVDRETLIAVLSGILTPRELKVVSLRFGLEDGGSKSLEGVGRVFGVTRERIRQIENGAFRKLRQPGNQDRLAKFRVS